MYVLLPVGYLEAPQLFPNHWSGDGEHATGILGCSVSIYMYSLCCAVYAYVYIMNLVLVHSLIPEVIFQEIESSPSVVSTRTHTVIIVCY